MFKFSGSVFFFWKSIHRPYCTGDTDTCRPDIYPKSHVDFYFHYWWNCTVRQSIHHSDLLKSSRIKKYIIGFSGELSALRWTQPKIIMNDLIYFSHPTYSMRSDLYVMWSGSKARRLPCMQSVFKLSQKKWGSAGSPVKNCFGWVAWNWVGQMMGHIDNRGVRRSKGRGLESLVPPAIRAVLIKSPYVVGGL